MSRPLRNTDPSKVHLITCRCASAEILLVPSTKVNEITGGVIARYAEIYKVELFAVNVLGNHYHIVARAPEGRIPQFAENINREISKRMNRLLSRQGHFWARRYDDQLTIELLDALEAVVYTATNAVKHGLVSHPKHWPGLSTYSQLIGEKEREYSFLHFSKYVEAKRKADSRGELIRKSDFVSRHKLSLSTLPIVKPK